MSGYDEFWLKLQTANPRNKPSGLLGLGMTRMPRGSCMRVRLA